jgi:hypothetical protein
MYLASDVGREEPSDFQNGCFFDLHDRSIVTFFSGGLAAEGAVVVSCIKRKRTIMKNCNRKRMR